MTVLRDVNVRGTNSAGAYVTGAMTVEGHQEVEVHGPLLPFGSVHTEKLRPIFQCDAVYGINTDNILTTTSATGTATASDSLITVATGTTNGAFATVQSRKRVVYHPGQGAIFRFTALFSSPVASSILVAGCGHAEDGFFVGYNGTSLGVLHSSRGVREVRTLTVTVGSSTAENVTVQLNGTNYTVAVTNSASTTKTAWEIAQGTYAGWRAEQIGATVLFINNSAGAKTGTYSLTGTTATGTFAQTKAGAAATDNWTTQANWNTDKLDGTGASGVTLDTTKINVFQIDLTYLGAGQIAFKCLVAASGNNPTWQTFHVMRFPNTRTQTTMRNPSMPFTAAAYSAGSTTNVSVSVGSFAGFVEGDAIVHGNRISYAQQSTSVTAAAYIPIFSIRNGRYFGGVSNQSVIKLLSVSGAVKHTQPVALYMIRDGTLAGTPSFTAYDTLSCAYQDTAATAVTFTNNRQLIGAWQLGETGNFAFQFQEDVTLQPGEMITVAAKASTGTPAYVLAALNTREDQ